MGWTEFQIVPNEYNDNFRRIDENLLQLLSERKSLTKGKRYFPPKDLMEEWSSKYQMEIPQISWLLHSINDRGLPAIPNEPGELLSVLSILKKSIVNGFEYALTHSMQHENGSVVFLEIKQINNDDTIGYLRPQLLLEVEGQQEYSVRQTGSHGGGGQTSMKFLVSPRLPEVMFALIPYAAPMESPPKEVILDQEVHFGQ
ncbi:hypothetical protein HQN89_32495 [Paenibacillus frigoriresistens]|uniref:hypothetical protein n=1 Tax=Paenibacillus alginolyticus TaxID=59839 RepID=UPI001567A263|nr:hypothetical protein [Paenibacillus frigoriresistens]NRF95559.1 hypothetical protein [Paenibacillus frigoriresistens]